VLFRSGAFNLCLFPFVIPPGIWHNLPQRNIPDEAATNALESDVGRADVV
jgi:hypothetical protein